MELQTSCLLNKDAVMRQKLQEKEEFEDLETEATHTLEEGRLITPGIQALFGFQLIAVFNEQFQKSLNSPHQMLHYAAVGLTVVAMAFLLAPAAYHRQAEPHEISRTFVQYATACLTIGLAALLCAICIDVFLVGWVITRSQWLSIAIAAVLALLLATVWFIVPLTARRLKRRRAA
jgi:hypothetical protein